MRLTHFGDVVVGYFAVTQTIEPQMEACLCLLGVMTYRQGHLPTERIGPQLESDAVLKPVVEKMTADAGNAHIAGIPLSYDRYYSLPLKQP